MSGSRNTSARIAINNLIQKSNEALSHHNIQSSLSGLCNRVTTYRVLGRLQKEGVIHRMVDMDGIIKYASCNHDCNSNHWHSHTHLHFSCTACNTVSCLNKVQPEFKLPLGYKAEETNFIISGICPKCS